MNVWNNCSHFQKMFDKNPLLQFALQEKTKRRRKKYFELNNFTYAISSTKYCSTALTSNQGEIVDIISIIDDTNLYVQSMKTLEFKTIPKKQIIRPMIRRFKLKRIDENSVTTFQAFEEYVNVADLA